MIKSALIKERNYKEIAILKRTFDLDKVRLDWSMKCLRH